MSTLGITVHHHRPEVVDLATQAIGWATEHAVEVRLPETDAELIGRPELGVPEAQLAVHDGDVLDGCLSLGGDGTMLRSSALVARHGVPVLGVNAGQLGYLTEVEPERLLETLTAWHAGSLSIEERMLIDVSVRCGDGSARHLGLALNEAVVERGESGRTVRLSVDLDDEFSPTYLADGLIIATPTGSTAYSMSAGGPVVAPDFAALLLTPVAAHSVFNRTLVLKPDTTVGVRVEGYRGAVVTIDGVPVGSAEPGDTVICRRASERARFVVDGPRNFFSVLQTKFGLGER